MQRRDFLLTSLLAALAGTAPAASPAAQALADARTIGRAALAEGTVSADPAALARALGLPDPSLRTLLARHWTPRIEGDLACADTLYTAGWLLSRTEVQLCALIALTQAANV
ncbi:hypothetical protein AAD018_006325 [Aestuariibius insulae]|uniref:hypothetical protein n=1 Tax=Aestuariibius insulae TaxID=2058287 RepID=UPI00345E776F